MEYQVRETIYENPLAAPGDVKGFAMEGEAAITFPVERMRMENMRDPEEGQAANFVYWCPEIFPDSIAISWDFWPVREPGLCILFFAAPARDGGDIFSLITFGLGGTIIFSTFSSIFTLDWTCAAWEALAAKRAINSSSLASIACCLRLPAISCSLLISLSLK